MKLNGRKIVVTAGPTHEAIDPVRYLGNNSSGKMGFALAEVAAEMGAKVILIAGPVHLLTPKNVARIDVVSAAEMYKAVLENLDAADVYISVAAVADFRPAKEQSLKIKKTGQSMRLELVPNVDILEKVAQLQPPPFIVGFAAETNDILGNAEKKLHKKHMDMVIANQVGKGVGFGVNQIEATVIKADGTKIALPLAEKKEIARSILNIVAEML